MDDHGARSIANPAQAPEALVVKSVSVGRRPPSGAFSQLHASGKSQLRVIVHCNCRHEDIPAGRLPQEQVDPSTLLFSVDARSQVH